MASRLGDWYPCKREPTIAFEAENLHNRIFRSIGIYASS